MKLAATVGFFAETEKMCTHPTLAGGATQEKRPWKTLEPSLLYRFTVGAENTRDIKKDLSGTFVLEFGHTQRLPWHGLF